MSTTRQAWKEQYRTIREEMKNTCDPAFHAYFCGVLLSVQKDLEGLLIHRRQSKATRAVTAHAHFHHILNTIWTKRTPRDRWNRFMLEEDRLYSRHWGFKLP